MKPEVEWKAEVEAAIAGGLPWRVQFAWCSPATGMNSAELVHVSSGRRRVVAVSRMAFPTPAQRKAEIVRQLQP